MWADEGFSAPYFLFSFAAASYGEPSTEMVVGSPLGVGQAFSSSP
jgi:hypothetical protein